MGRGMGGNIGKIDEIGDLLWDVSVGNGSVMRYISVLIMLSNKE